MLKAMLFDLDDTLIDWSRSDQEWEVRERELMRGVFDYVREQVHPLDDYDRLLANFSLYTRQAWDNGRNNLRAPHIGRVIKEALVATGVPPEAIDERRCLEAYLWRAAAGVKVFPDVPPFLELLVENGIKTGIVTNAYQPMWLRDFELTDFDLLRYFPKCRISAADAGFLKPHPAIFEHALKMVEADPSETVFVGDNPVADIAGAQGVGMRAVLRVTHPTPPMLSGMIVPDHAVNSFEQLPEVLDEWFPGWRA